MMARPRGGDWLSDEIQNLKRQNVSCVVSLLTSEEISELGLEKEETECKNLNIEFISYPVADRKCPDSERSFLELVARICNSLSDGQKIAVHCRMGIGRSGIVSAAVLIATGHKTSAVFDRLSNVRGLNVPDTKEQEDWIQNLESALRQVLT